MVKFTYSSYKECDDGCIRGVTCIAFNLYSLMNINLTILQVYGRKGNMYVEKLNCDFFVCKSFIMSLICNLA